MDEKKNIRELFENSDDETARRIADSHPVISEKTQEKVYSNIKSRIHADADEQVSGDSVHGVEVRRGGFSVRRFASLAAALAVLIGGIGMGTYFISRNTAPITFDEVIEKETSAEEETSVEAEEAIPEEAEPTEAAEEEFVPADFDMTDKLGIMNKMLNCVDYFDKVSGSFIASDTARADLCDMYSVSCDVTEGRAYETITRFDFWNSPYDILDGAEPEGVIDEYLGTFSVYNDGEREYDLYLEPNFTGETGTYSSSNHKSVKREDNAQVNVQDWLDWVEQNPDAGAYDRAWKAEEDGVKIWREDCTNCRASWRFIRPTEFVERLLTDTDNWEIAGTEEYAGRECTKLSGNIYYSESETELDPRYRTGSFTMLVDTKTGCVLKCEVYDQNDDLSEWYITKEIAFDDDAEDVPEVDLSELKDVTYYEDAEPQQTTEPEILTNSHGETYGFYGWTGVDDYEKAPDLISNVGKYQVRDGGYIRKSELFEKFGDYPCFDVKNIVRKTDSTPEGTDLNIYDSEGENVLYVITLY